MRGELCDSYARHFATYFLMIPKPWELRAIANFEILWQGNCLCTVKTFGTDRCKLCMRERVEILKVRKNEPTKLINLCLEIYGACRHKPKFHRFSTDEHDKCEMVTTNGFSM